MEQRISKKIECVKGYQGIFFDKKVADLLRRTALNLAPITNNERVIEDMHVTFNYGELVDMPTGDCTVRVVGFGADGKNTGFKVGLPDSVKQYFKMEIPHITVSFGKTGEPKDTAKLKFVSCEEFEVTGKFKNIILIINLFSQWNAR